MSVAPAKVDLEIVPETYEQAVLLLARWQADDIPGAKVYSFPDPERVEVRLLEVFEDFPVTGQVFASRFGRSEEFPFRSVTAMVAPEDLERVLSGELPLPDGWVVDEREPVDLTVDPSALRDLERAALP